MIAPLEGAFGIDQDVGDVLDVAHLGVAAPHFEQRVVGGGIGVGRVEQEHAAEARAPAGGQLPVLALDVVDDRGARPGEQGRDDQADALAGPGRRETQNMFRAIMAQIVDAETAEHDAVRPEQAGIADFARRRPARRAIGGDFLGFARAPHRHADCDRDRGEAARRSDDRALDEDLGA